ncbi:MAG: hypothetical protein R3B46_02315 [Phycisphaerales bacterium]
MLNTRADIDEAFDGVDAVAVDVLGDARGVVRHGVDHLAIGTAEPEVVLEEIGVAEDVDHDRFLIDDGVGLLGGRRRRGRC